MRSPAAHLGIIVYQCVATALVLLALPILLWRALRHPREMRERLGLRAPPVDPGAIWYHAASLGELHALQVLLEQIDRDAAPHATPDRSAEDRTADQVARTARRVTVTSISARRSSDLAALAVDGTSASPRAAVSFAPLDLWFCIAPFLAVRPRALVLVETEIWPALLHACQRRGIPVVVVSARLSDRNWRRRRLWAWLLRPLVRELRLVAAQESISADRFRELGAPLVEAPGNLKHAVPAPRSNARFPRVGDGDGAFLWTIGSLRRGEEDVLGSVRAFLSAPATTQPMVVLAPRHLREIETWIEACRNLGLVVLRRTEHPELDPEAGSGTETPRARLLDALRRREGDPPAVLLLDGHGELAAWYAWSDVAFVGGTLAPIGGHSLFEPASVGCPVHFGPHHANVRDLAEALRATGGGWCVANARELGERVDALRRDPKRAAQASEAAMAAARSVSGSAERTVRLMRECGVLGTASRSSSRSGSGVAS